MGFSQKIVAVICLISFISGGFLLYTGNIVYACSRVLSADNGQAVLVGRNMDWPEDMGTALWVLPRGIKREGLPGANSLSWTSKYGSIVLRLDLRNYPDYYGNVTKSFVESDPAEIVSAL